MVEEFKLPLPDVSYSVSDVSKDLEFVMKKLMILLDSDNKSIKIYSNKLKTG